MSENVEKAQKQSVEQVILNIARRIKQVIAGVLMTLMFGLVAVVTVELVGAIIPTGRVKLESLILDEKQLFSALGLFLTVLIALELIETVEVYFREHAVHVEIVVLVAIIALSRKFILLDPKTYSAPTLAALGFILLALGVTYFLVRRAVPANR